MRRGNMGGKGRDLTSLGACGTFRVEGCESYPEFLTIGTLPPVVKVCFFVAWHFQSIPSLEFIKLNTNHMLLVSMLLFPIFSDIDWIRSGNDKESFCEVGSWSPRPCYMDWEKFCFIKES